jgi:hypothetical protein
VLSVCMPDESRRSWVIATPVCVALRPSRRKYKHSPMEAAGLGLLRASRSKLLARTQRHRGARSVSPLICVQQQTHRRYDNEVLSFARWSRATEPEFASDGANTVFRCDNLIWMLVPGVASFTESDCVIAAARARLRSWNEGGHGAEFDAEMGGFRRGSRVCVLVLLWLQAASRDRSDKLVRLKCKRWPFVCYSKNALSAYAEASVLGCSNAGASRARTQNT